MSMQCDAIRDLLVEYQEATLSPEGRAEVETHLRTCAACAHEASLLCEAVARARELPLPEPSPASWAEFGVALRRRLAQEPAPRARAWRRAWRWLGDSLRPAPALVAATALGLLLAVGLVQTARVPNGRGSADPVVTQDEMRIGQNLDVLQQLDLLEDLEVLEGLPLVLPAA
jgi:anti-sigma factor RsiW